jgi:enamine deaminase RidA (YjgF/YER057c/UK114 family)
MSRQRISSNTGRDSVALLGAPCGWAGTTATDEEGGCRRPGDASAQTIYILRKVEAALVEARASLDDVTRTGIFIRRLEDSEAVAKGARQRLRRRATGQFPAARRADRPEVEAITCP